MGKNSPWFPLYFLGGEGGGGGTTQKNRLVLSRDRFLGPLLLSVSEAVTESRALRLHVNSGGCVPGLPGNTLPLSSSVQGEIRSGRRGGSENTSSPASETAPRLSQ